MTSGKGVREVSETLNLSELREGGGEEACVAVAC